MIEKNLHTLVPMEDCEKGVMYAISFNMRQQQDLIDPVTKVLVVKDRCLAHNKQTQKVLRLTTSFHWQLHMESSPTGRLHWHGYIIINDIMRFYIYDVPVLIDHMSICMKRITDSKKWEQYCHKQHPYMKKYMLEHLNWSPGPIAQKMSGNGTSGSESFLEEKESEEE